ncbi:formylglycine-generating enzyme family protein [Granulicella cerasi]|uniref:Formylglycine-generating enzyme family protein n=1 Tax=Granulicella cerasi TaxID=741063 RepID=A0ABW1Z859_9BACT|nr:formylglycine-generating enzyme family protein [Granulicella cerasi]
MFRRTFTAGFAALLTTLAASAVAQDTPLKMQGEQIEGPSCAGLPEWFMLSQPRPCTDAEFKTWLSDARAWRGERRIRVGSNDSEYTRPELLWTQSSFIQPQMMVHDRFFYDPARRSYTVARYLEDTDKRYGGIDSVLVWPTYPNIGVDDRNQYDLVHDMPGGMEGVKSFVAEFHKRGVKVLFPTMLWDQGTRVEGKPDAVALSEELAEAGADGINGDTLQGVPRTFREASDNLHHPLALEPELGPGSDEQLNWNNMTWGYWKYGFTPTVSRYKWMEPRHMVNISNRWAHDHTDDLQFAFFNGIGFESWENVWGIWNGITPQDGEALRRVSAIERAEKSLLISQEWEPYAPVRNYGVFASKWPAQSETLWTIVNRNHYSVSGRQLAVKHVDGVRYFDLWNGIELHADREGDHDVLSFSMEANGYGAVLATATLNADMQKLMRTMHTLSEKPLASYSHEWKTLPQQLVAIAKTKPAKSAPDGMKLIAATEYLFRVNGVEIEGTNDEGVDVQYPGEGSARRYHELKMHVGAFYLDTYPVTNAEFKKFVDAAHYHPADHHNFLRDWKNGSFPDGWANKPVTWVSLEDARAYAAWAGKRLPHEWEWQYAAQGNDGREYPWGNQWVAANVPTPDKDRNEQAASDVNAHAAGASPFGIEDLVGNVWQWTDEYTDEHTSAAILRGGSHYQPQGSRWYFPQAYKLSQHGKYLLMAPSLDRSASIGFRCAKDAE